jgi:hypothetical protein
LRNDELVSALTVQRRNDSRYNFWPVWQDGQLVASVSSLDSARSRARKYSLDLRVQEIAYRQMVDAGVAPEDPPADVLII